MTPEQLEEFWAKDPTILRPIEAQEIEAVRNGVNVVPIAIGIGAAYLVYRRYMSQRIKDAIDDRKRSPSPGMMETVSSLAWETFVPNWVSMLAPYIIAGYIEGMQLTKMGFVPTEYLEQIAYGYAQELGNHINEVSQEALLQGYTAQINRKVPEVKAAKRVADAYGVPPRAMNTLVNLWTTEDPKALTNRPVRDIKSMTAQNIIDTQNEIRARVTGDNEYWSARTQAKQLVWMYGVEAGVIPSSARRTWVTAADEKVCAVCGPMHEKAALIGEQFETAGGRFWTPPAHVNCRCDVILDFSFDEELERTYEQLLHQAEVSKARAGDPYDRDKRGRFASTESRTAFKEPTPTIKLGGIKIGTGVDEAKIAAALKAADEEIANQNITYKAPSFGGGGFKGYKAPTFQQETQFKPGYKPAEFKPKFEIKFSPQFQQNVGFMADEIKYNAPKDFNDQKKTADGDWVPLEHPVVLLMTAADMIQGDNILTTDKTELFELRSSDSTPDRYERSLEKAVSKHWYKVIKDETEEYRQELNDVLEEIDVNGYVDEDLNPRPVYKTSDGSRFIIDEDVYTQALTEYINGVPRAASDKVVLYGMYEPDTSIEIRAWDVIRHLDVASDADRNKPTLVVINHGGPAHYRKANDIHVNPGRWKLASQYEGRQLAHMPYFAFYADPMDLKVPDFDE